MMFPLTVAVFFAWLNACLAYQDGGPVDCAHSVWSAWSDQSDGQYQIRTRSIIRQASGGGKPCVGKIVQYRSPMDEPDNVPAEEKFLSRFLPGDRPWYSLGGGNSNTRYTLSRDLLVMLDTTVISTQFPYYKSFVANLVGKLCGDIGTDTQHNRIALASFDSRTSTIHDFDGQQSRASIQDEILRIPASPLRYSNLSRALSFATTAVFDENLGIRRYNNATKDVLIMTAYREDCASDIVNMARRLLTRAVVYVVVVGEGVTNRRPADWCLEDHVASDPPEFYFLQLENIDRLSHVSCILLGQSVENNKFCRSNAGAN